MGISASLFYSTNNQENCLDWRIRSSDEQYDAQQERWNDLAEFLLAHLREKSGYPVASWLQGSYKLATQIRPASAHEEFDIDLGVYFEWAGTPEDGRYTAVALKDLVQSGLEAYCDEESNEAVAVDDPHKKCSRIHFKDSFHIDVPAYHLDRDRDARRLATSEDRWEDSDPKAIYKWWKDAIGDDERPRCRRIVRCLKMWVALNFEEKGRPSSILLTVMAAQAFLALDADEYDGDDELLHAILREVATNLATSSKVNNPANPGENLNRLSAVDNANFRDKLDEFISVAERALAAPTKTASAYIWSETFRHFFPVVEEEAIQLNDSRALATVSFDPQVAITASTKTRKFAGRNGIGPIPKGCAIDFRLANAQQLPHGATLTWTVRNFGTEAEKINDLGHVKPDGIEAHEDSAYKGKHFMDVVVRLNGRVIGSRRVPVEVSGLGMPLRNLPRPDWTRFRSKKK